MIESPHRLLLASAGTGKTWRLTGHFLALCLRGVDPARILATTFTRKAAGEIQDRVLARLAEAVASDAKRAELREQVERPRLERAECVALLARIARGLDRLQIRTLDSFFSHLARLFAFELALPPDWRIADEREDVELRAEAVARVLEDAGAEERLELLRALQRDAGARSVHQTLLRVVREARSEARDCAEGAWDVVRPQELLGEERVAELRARLEAWPLPRTKQGKPYQHWEKNFGQLAASLAGGDGLALLGIGLVKKVIAGESTFSNVPIEEELRELLGLVARQAAAVEIAALVRRNAAARAFLARFESSYAELQRERASLRFDDLPPALASLGEQRDELWFRLDARIDHLLLDEFQDTAPAQWRVLEPFAQELASHATGEKSFFCVGDVKQSIYGWRSAEPRLLSGLEGRLPGLAATPMDVSFRSSPVVLDAVDRVFARVAECPLFDGEENLALRGAAERWTLGYRAHRAAKPEREGAVVLYEAAQALEDESAELPPLRKAVERAAALRAESPDATVGILVRRNKHIPWLIERLRERGVAASGEGGNPLTDSDAVQVFLSALHLADHPRDGAAAFHVASSPFGAALELALADFERDAAALSRGLRARLLREGYGGLAGTLAPVVASAPERWGEWDRRRFARLVDLACAYDARGGSLRATAFAEHVRATRVEEPSAAGVRVMTVHASKGLEFECVVLPELDVALCGGRHALLVRRADPYGPIDAITLPPRKELAPFDPVLAELREHARGRELEESLSVLYVAMTRAARRLEMVVRHPESRGRVAAASFAALLRASFPLDAPDAEGAIWRHERSSDARAWCAKPERSSKELEDEPRVELAPSPPGARPWARSPSAEEGRGARAGELLRARDERSARFGTLVHRFLEELEWIEDFARSDEELLALAATVEPDRELAREALAFLRAALSKDELRAALARPKGARAAAVARERGFSVLLPDDEVGGETLWSGAIDRLVVEREGGRAVAATVLDYKTDRVEGEVLAARVEFYRPQLEAYRRVAARVLELERGAVRARLVFLHAGRVIELEGPESVR